ncbi:hypothetical protein ACFXDE_42475 [Kitasatospora sp. NPDC059408]|uniref:hypothetical protein n=1 Tax=Kitasatospora sp. NPDC059408 TaxID=3346823 RepID=UPI0036BD2FC8
MTSARPRSLLVGRSVLIAGGSGVLGVTGGGGVIGATGGSSVTGGAPVTLGVRHSAWRSR